MTNPWTILGWIVLITFVIIPVATAMVRLAILIARDIKANRLRKRANAGKVRCQERTGRSVETYCEATATHRTSRGYFCRDHCNSSQARGVGSFSFASPLDWYSNRLDI